MEKTRPCPECGVENPVSSITCQVCHARMDQKKNPKGSPNPFEEETGPDAKDTTEKKTRSRRKKEVIPEDKKEEKKVSAPKVKRRAKRKSKIEEPTFFTIQNGKLQAVNVRLAEAWIGELEHVERAARHDIEDDVDQDGHEEQQDDRLDQPPDDKGGHAAPLFGGRARHFSEVPGTWLSLP